MYFSYILNVIFSLVHKEVYIVVTVQSNHQVRITDFGLAKLLDYEEEAFHGTGGKVWSMQKISLYH